MALDPTAREANVRDSVKKYLIDTLGSYCPITFDRSLESPTLQGRKVDKWLAVQFSFFSRGQVSDFPVDVYCCTRQDNEGFKNAQLVDKVIEALTDPDQPDGLKRIVFYKSHPSNPWEVIGGLIVQDFFESRTMTTEDETKYKYITARLRFASKI